MSTIDQIKNLSDAELEDYSEEAETIRHRLDHDHRSRYESNASQIYESHKFQYELACLLDSKDPDSWDLERLLNHFEVLCRAFRNEIVTRETNPQ